ncbi:amidohydrolase family protein [Halostagnicola sp. A-GB9-2]|uniref:amidohydrolase family protein n=1 Tax=Halostagnicola sp. A-GB9-2 TaxID=3048066 RepID=UPI0024C0B6CB|nr:amidohydrolase family protein [Halostagnicola sp. A-GB9-2]MDJ1433754.1 amidohydrolase family protein [Halostagnicola sp. A-GB9-2]
MSETAKHATSETTVIDADVHITVEEETVAKYMDEPYRSSITESPHPIFPSSSWDQRMGGKIDDHFSTFTSAGDLLTFQKEFDIEYPIINMFEPLGKFSQPDLAVNLMQAYNNLLFDQFLDDHDFLGLASIATQKPDKAAEELDRVGDEDQIVGVYVGTSGEYPPLGDPEYDIIFQAAEDNGLPIVYHGNGDEFMFDFPIHNRGFNNYFEVQTLGHPWQQMATMSSLIGEGVPEKFPELDFVFLESGIGWVPYMMHRMNKIYHMRRSEVPLLEKSPEEYLRDSFYFGSQPLGEPNDPAHMKQIIGMIGADNLMFATDYPHWDFDHVEELDKYLRNYFTEEEREKVLYETPAEAFNLSL